MITAPSRQAAAADSGRSPSPDPASAREGFLDAVRAIAILRVIAWHAFGVAAITYFVAAMPAMFFVSGSLLVKSFRRRPARTVLLDRFRRLLVPLWAFALVAWLLMALAAAHAGAGLPLHKAAAWVFPVIDPHGTAWEGGWLSSHLWYLRTLTWLLLASPLLVRAARARPLGTPCALVGAVFALEALSRAGLGRFLGNGLTWGLGDLALYSVFFVAGFLHRDGAFRRVPRLGWVGVALVAGVAAVAWRLTQPVPLGVVNNSHPMHLFVGAGWLALALAAQPALSRLATSALTGPAVRAIGRRSLTIYLWHTAAIIVAVNVLEKRGIHDPLAHSVGLVLLTFLGILVCVRFFGWIEDVAARRPRSRTRPRPLPVPVPAPTRRPRMTVGWLALATAVVLTAAVIITSGDEPPLAPAKATAATTGASASAAPSRRPPIPSKPPPPPVFRSAPVPVAAPGVSSAPPQKIAADLDGVLEEWAAETGAPGAVAGVAVGDTIVWTDGLGTLPGNGHRVSVDDPIDLASLTKLFTAVLVHRAAGAGLVDLAAPVPTLAALPDFPYDEGITVEQLLDHTSGLANYRATAAYQDDPDSIADPLSAIRASLAEPRLNPPGAAHNYSSTNYLVLGALLEQVTGKPFSKLLDEQFITPLGLRDTIHEPSAPGQPRGATSGIITSLEDLLTAGVAILRDHAGLSDGSYAHLTAIDLDSGYGPGTFGFCPCRIDANGVHQFFAVGAFGATTVLGYSPALDLTIAVDLVDLPGDISQYGPVTRLFELLERRLAHR